MKINENAEQTRFLRIVLRANAIFSASSGAVIAISASRISPWYGLSDGLALVFLGVGLVGFGVLLWSVASRSQISVPMALLAVTSDALWVIGSAIILMMAGGSMSKSGIGSIISVAFIVMLFAVFQWLGIKRIQNARMAKTAA